LADDGFVSVLKKMPIPIVPAVKIDHITGKKPSHAIGKRLSSCSNQKVEVIGHEGPGIDNNMSFST
jgi:hypothetical protein